MLHVIAWEQVDGSTAGSQAGELVCHFWDEECETGQPPFNPQHAWILRVEAVGKGVIASFMVVC